MKWFKINVSQPRPTNPRPTKFSVQHRQSTAFPIRVLCARAFTQAVQRLFHPHSPYKFGFESYAKHSLSSCSSGYRTPFPRGQHYSYCGKIPRLLHLRTEAPSNNLRPNCHQRYNFDRRRRAKCPLRPRCKRGTSMWPSLSLTD